MHCLCCQRSESFQLDPKLCDQSADGWSLLDRGSDGKIIADPNKFPSGIKHVSDYIHDKGSQHVMSKVTHMSKFLDDHEARYTLYSSAFTCNVWMESYLCFHTAHLLDCMLLIFVHCILIKGLIFSALADICAIKHNCLIQQILLWLNQHGAQKCMKIPFKWF